MLNKGYSGHRQVKEEDCNQRTLGKEIRRKKYGQQTSDTAGETRRRQHKTELDGDNLSGLWLMQLCSTGSNTRHKSSSQLLDLGTTLFSFSRCWAKNLARFSLSQINKYISSDCTMAGVQTLTCDAVPLYSIGYRKNVLYFVFD